MHIPELSHSSNILTYLNRYIPAKITIVAVNAGAIIISTMLRVVYGRRNARANRLGRAAGSRMEERLRSEGDDEGVVDFRYVY